tara:strand:+ start:38 stop:1120 length:1083 start_codon:yes stop_codon:yes gene_type:complete
MADFTTANLPGASKSFNAARSKLDGIKGTLKSNMEVDASTLTGVLNTDLLDFGDKLKAMIPELPSLPDISLQAELATFAQLSGKLAAQALASITSKFGDGVKQFDFDLGDLASQAKDATKLGENIASRIPNITIPSAGGVAKLLPNNVKQADVNAIEEVVSEKVKTEITEEVKKKTVTNLEVKKTLVSYNSREEVTTSGGGSTTTFSDGRVVRTDDSGVETVIKESPLKPEGYLKKEDPEVETVDTIPVAPAIELTAAERMGLTPEEYERHKQLRKETQALTKELKEDPTFSISDERRGNPTGGDEDLKESRQKRINELNDIRAKGRFRLKESERLQKEGFSRTESLDASGIRPDSLFDS